MMRNRFSNGGTKYLSDDACTGEVTTKPEQLVFKHLDRLKKKMEAAQEHIER